MMSKNLFIGLGIGAIVVTVTIIGAKLYYDRNKLSSESETNNIVENDTTMPPQDFIPDNSLKERLQENFIEANFEHVKIEETSSTQSKHSKNILNITYELWDNNKHYKFSLLEDALSNYSEDYKFKIKFDKNLITDHVETEDFLSWLVLVGDYIFARRLVLVDDLYKVLNNAELARTRKSRIRDYGSILFSKEQNSWRIEIRGLQGKVEEMRIVSEIISQALKFPESLMLGTFFEPAWLSDAVGKYQTLTEQEKNMLDDFHNYVSFCDQSFGYLKIENNYFAVLPLVEFINAPNITKAQKKIITLLSKKFIKDFYERVQSGLDGAELKDFCESNYDFFLHNIKQWAVNTDISSIIKQALFRDIN